MFYIKLEPGETLDGALHRLARLMINVENNRRLYDWEPGSTDDPRAKDLVVPFLGATKITPSLREGAPPITVSLNNASKAQIVVVGPDCDQIIRRLTKIMLTYPAHKMFGPTSSTFIDPGSKTQILPAYAKNAIVVAQSTSPHTAIVDHKSSETLPPHQRPNGIVFGHTMTAKHGKKIIALRNFVYIIPGQKNTTPLDTMCSFYSKLNIIGQMDDNLRNYYIPFLRRFPYSGTRVRNMTNEINYNPPLFEWGIHSAHHYMPSAFDKLNLNYRLQPWYVDTFTPQLTIIIDTTKLALMKRVEFENTSYFQYLEDDKWKLPDSEKDAVLLEYSYAILKWWEKYTPRVLTVDEPRSRFVLTDITDRSPNMRNQIDVALKAAPVYTGKAKLYPYRKCYSCNLLLFGDIYIQRKKIICITCARNAIYLKIKHNKKQSIQRVEYNIQTGLVGDTDTIGDSTPPPRLGADQLDPYKDIQIRLLVSTVTKIYARDGVTFYLVDFRGKKWVAVSGDFCKYPFLYDDSLAAYRYPALRIEK